MHYYDEIGIPGTLGELRTESLVVLVPHHPYFLMT